MLTFGLSYTGDIVPTTSPLHSLSAHILYIDLCYRPSRTALAWLLPLDETVSTSLPPWYYSSSSVARLYNQCMRRKDHQSHERQSIPQPVQHQAQVRLALEMSDQPAICHMKSRIRIAYAIRISSSSVSAPRQERLIDLCLQGRQPQLHRGRSPDIENKNEDDNRDEPRKWVVLDSRSSTPNLSDTPPSLIRKILKWRRHTPPSASKARRSTREQVLEERLQQRSAQNHLPLEIRLILMMQPRECERLAHVTPFTAAGEPLVPTASSAMSNVIGAALLDARSVWWYSVGPVTRQRSLICPTSHFESAEDLFRREHDAYASLQIIQDTSLSLLNRASPAPPPPDDFRAGT
ncbi:hypothetical protein BKA70DRAFT_1444344 [Coprinopsis sp. MPI-PUGE-AT-0042]|nr:hypothetical protein BKA70DRAFT_1444344 [Coprinopsis sp. MPI-PUGE-AT-0042]